MTIRYQGAEAQTDAATIAAFLESRGVDAAQVVVEWNDEIFAPGDPLDIPLAEGGRLSIFRVVAGG